MTPTRRLRASRWVTVGAGVVLVVAAVILHVSRVGWGLDRTDEGQYLLLLAHPEDSRSTVFLFGYVLHPLFTALGGSIVGIRIVGAVVSVLLAGALGFAAARTSAPRRDDSELATTLLITVVTAGFGLGPLLYFPLTPSYNTLAFWGACLWATGLLLATDPVPPGAATHGFRRVWTGAVLLGVGGVVAFAGKATTGAAFGALTLLLVPVVVATATHRAARAIHLVGGIAIGGGVSLVCLMALVGHGLGWLVDFYAAGASSVSLLQGHEDLVRLDPFVARGLVGAPVLLAMSAICLALAAAVEGRRVLGVLAGGAGLLAIAATLLDVTGTTSGSDSPAAMLAWWWIPVLVVVGTVTRLAPASAGRSRRGAPVDGVHGDPAAPPEPLRRSRADRLREVAVVVTLAVLPLAYVVGTNGNYWIAQSRAAVFWVMAGVVVLARRPAILRAFAAGVALLLLVVVAMSLGYAYRYEAPVHAWRGAVSTGSAVVSPEGAGLRLTAEDAETSRRLAVVARDHHLDGVPILDVTGASPGYIRQLGGRPVGSSWLLGGYPGSTDAALEAVRAQEAEDPGVLDRAWVLDAPQSRRRIPGLLPALGRTAGEYELVTTFRHHLGYEVDLLRPRTAGQRTP